MRNKILGFLLLVLNFVFLQWFFVRFEKIFAKKIEKNESCITLIKCKECESDGYVWAWCFAAPLSGYFGMELIVPKDFRFMAWIIAYFSIAGVIVNVFKSPVCFVIWGVTNTFWMVYNFRKKEYAQAFIFLVYLIVAVFGFLKWSGVLNG